MCLKRNKYATSVITGKENASKDWSCINIDVSDEFYYLQYFVFGYACFMRICLKTAIWLFLTRSVFLWWRQVANPASEVKSCSHNACFRRDVRIKSMRRRITQSTFCAMEMRNLPNRHCNLQPTYSLMLNNLFCSTFFVKLSFWQDISAISF